MEMSRLFVAVRDAFLFLGAPIETQFVRSETVCGGFILRYENSVEIKYLDRNFQVTSSRGVLFGQSNRNPSFETEFSPQHLYDWIGRIAEQVRPQLGSTAVQPLMRAGSA